MTKWIFAFLIAVGCVANAGNEVNNGGDIVRCLSSEDLLTLDYVMTRNLWGKKGRPASVSSLEQSLERIGMQIDRKLPRLSRSFYSFVADVTNSTDRSRNHIWIPTRDEVPQVFDERIHSLPIWCRSPNVGKPTLWQAVLRTEIPRKGRTPHVQFQYDEESFSIMNPLQKSFLVIHEWLWGISKDVVVNREINYYLHSRLIETQTPAQVRTQLKKISNGKL